VVGIRVKGIGELSSAHYNTNIKHPVIYTNDFPTLLCIQWDKKVFSQPPIVQVLPLKKMREACNFHHRYTSSMM
jgi:hypothetical protein